jgi:NAD(P)-dependent dehydrogenase (short-subunit alcohol dehydrogenase family)
MVTGASQGIGRSIALGLAAAGADVVVNYNQQVDAAETVVAQIQSLGRRAIALQGDVSQRGHVEHMVQQALTTLGRIDVLVNNAGVLLAAPIENLSEADWDRVIAVNLKGVFLCCQAVGTHMISRHAGGVIINVASISGHLPEIYAGAYTPSKAGVIGLTRLLAIEWAPYHIRVNALSPGPILTPLQHTSFPTEALLQARSSAVPMNRHGTPEEIAGVAVFLASDDASFITGEEITADGGSQFSMFQLVHKMARP